MQSSPVHVEVLHLAQSIQTEQRGYDLEPLAASTDSIGSPVRSLKAAAILVIVTSLLRHTWDGHTGGHITRTSKRKHGGMQRRASNYDLRHREALNQLYHRQLMR